MLSVKRPSAARGRAGTRLTTNPISAALDLSSSQPYQQMVLSDGGLKMTLGLEGKGLRRTNGISHMYYI